MEDPLPGNFKTQTEVEVFISNGFPRKVGFRRKRHGIR